MSEEKGKMITLSGLWKSKSGTSLSGTLGGARLVIFKNNKKTSDKQPDFYLAIAEQQKREQAPVKSRNFAPTNEVEDLPFD